KLHKNLSFCVYYIDINPEFEYNGTGCFNVKVSDIGSAKAIIYDIKALRASLDYIKRSKFENSIIYILACRIGPFMAYYKKIASKLGVKIFVNPDGACEIIGTTGKKPEIPMVLAA
ncbi:MAG: glycosyltransferase family 1 protein, partial [Clostridiales bacterium]|nr:glycosyltransferase family 1 protein [Clostridiales bacterium]